MEFYSLLDEVILTLVLCNPQNAFLTKGRPTYHMFYVYFVTWVTGSRTIQLVPLIINGSLLKQV